MNRIGSIFNLLAIAYKYKYKSLLNITKTKILKAYNKNYICITTNIKEIGNFMPNKSNIEFFINLNQHITYK